MTGRALIDSKILAYAHERGAGVRHQRAKALAGQFQQEPADFLRFSAVTLALA